MPGPPGTSEPEDRASKLRRVVDDYIRRRVAGDSVAPEQVVAQHPDLMPELEHELRNLKSIEDAHERALGKLRTDTAPAADLTAPSESESGAPTQYQDTEEFGTATMTLLLASQFGDPPKLPDYELLRRIGTGAFGQVWLAQNRHDQQYYAIKFVQGIARTELASIQHYKARVKEHPHLVPITYVGESGEFLYYVMPLADDVNGPAPLRSPHQYEPMTLRKYLVHQRYLPVDESLSIARELLVALEHVHRTGLIHCDVKPENILSIQGRWSLGDPGLVARNEDTLGRRGTEPFLPREGVQDSRADLYALGRTLFLLLTGEELEHFEEFTSGSLSLPEEDLRAEPVRRIIATATHEDPAQRFPSAGKMRREIEQLLRPVPRHARSHVLWPAAVVAVAVGVGVAIYNINAPPSAPSTPSVPPAKPLPQPLRIKAMSISHYRGPESQYLGDIGIGSVAACVDDDIRLHADLTRPAYCYLVALNPDGSEQLCYPEDRAAVPALIEKIDYPRGPRAYFGLTDGVGFQAFVLVASQKPLPPYAQWRSQAGTLPWGRTNPEDGTWCFDGARFDRLGETRGQVRERGGPPKAFAEVCQVLKTAPAIEQIRAVAFPILPRGVAASAPASAATQ